MNDRERVLRGVRDALRDVSSDQRPASVEVTRCYATRSPLSAWEAVALFIARASDYGATVRRAEVGSVGLAVSAACAAHAARRLAIPLGLPVSWRPADCELVTDDQLSVGELDALDGAITGCALAIAETGTVALDCGPGQGRRALTLVPDLHICVIGTEQVVGSVPEAIATLADSVRTERRPVTLISGPSATSDIELIRVEGVHGPRRLELIVTG